MAGRNQQRIRVNRESQATRCETCHQSDNYDPNTNICSFCNSVQQPVSVMTPPNLDQRLNEQEGLLDRRQERIGARERSLEETEQMLDQREQALSQRESLMQEQYSKPIKKVNPIGSFVYQVLAGIGALFIVLMIIANIYGRFSSPSPSLVTKVEPELSLPMVDDVTKANTDEEMPYQLELSSDPKEVAQNPTVTLTVGSLTTMDLDEVPKEILAGDKDVVEITKSPTNPQRVYLTGKKLIGNSNIIIETASKTITVFFEVVENTGIGGFNGEVIVGSKPKGKS